MHKILKIKKISIIILLVFLVLYGYYRKTRSLDVLHSQLVLSSQIGTVEEGTNRVTAAEGKEGFLVYGPYLPMKEGSYALSYKVLLANLNPTADPQKTVGFCDVNVVDNPQYNVRYDLKIRDFLQKNPQEIVLKFYVPSRMPKVEFRVFQQNAQNLSLQSLHLSPTIRYIFVLAKRFRVENYLYLIVGLSLLFFIFLLSHKFLHLKLGWAIFLFLGIVVLQYMWLRKTFTQNVLNGSYALSTQVGVKDQKKGQFTGEGAGNGFLVYGPYVPLQEGEYEIRYRLSFDNIKTNKNQLVGFCDINIVDSLQNNSRVDLYRDIFEKNNPAEIRLKFTIPQGTHCTEFRVFQCGGNILTLQSLILKPVNICSLMVKNKERFFQNVLYMCGALLLISLYLKFTLSGKDKKTRYLYLFSTLLSVGSGLILAWIWQYKGYNIRHFQSYYDMWRVFYAPAWLPLMFIFFNFLYLINSSLGFKRNTEKFLRYDSWTLLIFPLFIILGMLVKNFPTRMVLGNLYLGLLVIKSIIYFVFLWQNLKEQQDIQSNKAVKWTIFLSIFTVYLLITPWVNAAFYSDGDETAYLLMAQSLVKDGDLDITNNVIQDDCLSYHPSVRWTHWGGMYTRALTSIIISPGVMIGGRFGATIVMSMIGTLMALILFLLTYFITHNVKSSYMTLIFASFTSPLGIYALLSFPEIIAAFIVSYVLYLLLLNKANSYQILGITIILAFFLIFLKERYMPLSIMIIAALVTKIKWNLKKLVTAALLLVVGVILFFAYDKLVWNRVISHRILWLFKESSMPTRGIFSGIFGLFFDQETGLYIYSPLYLASIFGLVSLWRINKKIVLSLILVLLPYFLSISSNKVWASFGSPAPRYLVAIVPILVLGVALFLTYNNRLLLRVLTWGAIIWSLAVYYVFLLVPQARVPNPNIVSGRNQLLDWLYAKSILPNLSIYFPSYLKPNDLTFYLTAMYISIIIVFIIYYVRQEKENKQKDEFWLADKGIKVLIIITILLFGFAQYAYFNYQEYKAVSCYAGGAYLNYEGDENYQVLAGVNVFILNKIALRMKEKVTMKIRASGKESSGWPALNVSTGNDQVHSIIGRIEINDVVPEYRVDYEAENGGLLPFWFEHANFVEHRDIYLKQITFMGKRRSPLLGYLNYQMGKLDEKLQLSEFAGQRYAIAAALGYSNIFQ